MNNHIIIGTGRCGTGFVAAILTLCGYPTGHEVAHSPSGPGKLPEKFIGEASWLAVPYVSEKTHKHIIHLVRNPWHVIRSLVAVRPFTQDTDYNRFARSHLPDMPEDDLGAAIHFYIEWNLLCEAVPGAARIRVEDINAVDRISGLVKTIGGEEVDFSVAGSALGRISTGYNTRLRADISWTDILSHDRGPQVYAMGKSHGYSI